MDQKDYTELIQLLDYWYKAKTGKNAPSTNLPVGGSYTVIKDNGGQLQIVTNSKSNTNVKKQSSNKNEPDLNFRHKGDAEKTLDAIRQTIRETITNNMPQAGSNFLQALMYSNPLTYLLWQNRDIFTKSLTLGAKTLDFGGKIVGSTLKGISNLFPSGSGESSQTNKGANNRQKLSTVQLPRLTTQQGNSGIGGSNIPVPQAMRIQNALITNSNNNIIAQNVTILGGHNNIITSGGIRSGRGGGNDIPLLSDKLGSTPLLPGSDVPLLPGPTLTPNDRLDTARRINAKSVKTITTLSDNTQAMLEESKKTNKLLDKNTILWTAGIIGGVAILTGAFLLLKNKLPQILQGLKWLSDNIPQLLKQGFNNVKQWIDRVASLNQQAKDYLATDTKQKQVEVDTDIQNGSLYDVKTDDLVKLDDKWAGTVEGKIGKLQKNAEGYWQQSYKLSKEMQPILARRAGAVTDITTFGNLKGGRYAITIETVESAKVTGSGFAPNIDVKATSLTYVGIVQPIVARGDSVKQGEPIGYGNSYVQIYANDLSGVGYVTDYDKFVQPYAENNWQQAKDILGTERTKGRQDVTATQRNRDLNQKAKDIDRNERYQEFLENPPRRLWQNFKNVISGDAFKPSGENNYNLMTKSEGSISTNSKNLENLNANKQNKTTNTASPTAIVGSKGSNNGITVTQDFGTMPAEVAVMASGVNVVGK